MQFWRTLFERQTTPYRPQTQVVAVTQPTTTNSATTAQTISLKTLALSSTGFTNGTPSSGTINNATAGTTIVGVGLPTGLTVNSSARTWAWDGTGSAGSGSFKLYENFPGGTSSPNISTILYSISGGVRPGQLDFNFAADSGLLALLEDI